MKKLALAATALALTAALTTAQENRNPTAIKQAVAADVSVRYLDFVWNPAAFESLEKGTAKRSWVIARTVSPAPLKWSGHEIPDGTVLILHPAQGDQPISFEMRAIKMQELFVDFNVIAEPPDGKTLNRAPAGFAKVEKTAERLELGLKEADGKLHLTVHYGNQQAKIELSR